MKRYAMPLIILGFIALLIGLIVFGGKSAPDYGNGQPTEQDISKEWVRGNNQAANIVVAYSDFQCPACKAYEPLVSQMVESYGDRVAFVHRQFPLYQIHPNADVAARASEAAGIQGKFWEMYDLLFDKQEEWSKKPSPQSTFETYAATIGLDVERFKSDLQSVAVAQYVADDYARGNRQGVQGTPSFFLNGSKISPQSVQEFSDLLDAVLGEQGNVPAN